MITRLDPSIPVAIELDFFPDALRPKSGSAECIGWMDYGIEQHLIWICALDEGGAVWCVPNPKIRLYRNVTLGRR